MQKITEKTEYIGDLRAEFQEIDRMYEHETVVGEIKSITGQCMQLLTILCC